MVYALDTPQFDFALAAQGTPRGFEGRWPSDLMRRQPILAPSSLPSWVGRTELDSLEAHRRITPPDGGDETYNRCTAAGRCGWINILRLFMDESGNGNSSQPLIVGAVELGDDAEDVEENVRALHKRLSASRSLAGLESFKVFRENGFHGNNDPTEISAPFLELMRNTFFRAYMVVTDRNKVPGESEADRIEFMYAKLLSDLLIKHRKAADLSVYIEQSTGMRPIVERLPSLAADQARKTLGNRVILPHVNIEIVAKTDYMSMAIVDYVMAAASRWLRADRTTDPRNWAYRAFRDIEPSVSLLYSFEHGRISSRKDDLK